MGQASGLPVWVNLVWMSISGITLFGGVIWIVFIFWPYLRETKKMQIEGLDLGRQSNNTLADLVRKVDPVIEKIERTAERVEDTIKKFEKHDLNKFEKAIQEAPSRLKEMAGYMKDIRDRVHRDTELLPVRERHKIKAVKADNGQ